MQRKTAPGPNAVPLPVRTALAASALIALANCTAPTASQSTRNAPPEAMTPITRGSGPDLACLAEAVYFEARGTGVSGESAVAHVVVNRARSPKFPGSVCGVVGDGCQFSYRCDGRPDVLADPRDRARAFTVAETVLSGAPDITRGALFFHAATVAPGWFDTRPRIGRIGGNVFYR
jgi:N-acetylmuramoyl-L-alanine amidase